MKRIFESRYHLRTTTRMNDGCKLNALQLPSSEIDSFEMSQLEIEVSGFELEV